MPEPRWPFGNRPTPRRVWMLWLAAKERIDPIARPSVGRVEIGRDDVLDLGDRHFPARFQHVFDVPRRIPSRVRRAGDDDLERSAGCRVGARGHFQAIVAGI